jgi:hypothetical protein
LSTNWTVQQRFLGSFRVVNGAIVVSQPNPEIQFRGQSVLETPLGGPAAIFGLRGRFLI